MINLFGIYEKSDSINKDNIDIIKAEEVYKSYIDTHINNVNKAYKEMKSNTKLCNMDLGYPIEEIFNYMDKRIPLHDKTKYSDEEFYGYRVRWYPVTEEEKEYANMDEDYYLYKIALKHHYIHNSHHPDHYIREDGFIMDMPIHDILEMLCDWESFKYINNNDNACIYWENNREDESKLMSDNTILLVDKIIKIM